MARGGRGASSAQARRIIDLSGCISHGEKVNLSILVTAITDRMNDQISDIFDSPPVTPTGRDHEFNWLMFPISNPAPAGAWNKAAPRKKGFQCPKTFGGNHMVSMSTITDDRTQSPQLQELKKEALVSFVKWQTNLLQKLREIEVRDPQAHLGPMGAPRGRGRGAPRGGGGRGLDRNGNGGGRGGGFAPTGLPVPTGSSAWPLFPHVYLLTVVEK